MARETRTTQDSSSSAPLMPTGVIDRKAVSTRDSNKGPNIRETDAESCVNDFTAGISICAFVLSDTSSTECNSAIRANGKG